MFRGKPANLRTLASDWQWASRSDIGVLTPILGGKPAMELVLTWDWNNTGHRAHDLRERKPYDTRRFQKYIEWTSWQGTPPYTMSRNFLDYIFGWYKTL